MSILSRSNSSDSGKSFFHEFRRQVSFFLKEKIKIARLTLTDVTPAQLLTEEATDGNPLPPDARTLYSISRAAFDLDDYWRIVKILHKRLAKFEKPNWRVSYNTLIVLEHLLSHGPESTADEFEGDIDVITQMGNFQHIDEKGFNWGMKVSEKSERMLQLLEKGPFLEQERDRARKLSRGMEGFGSLNQRSSSAAHGVLIYGRSNSDFNHEDLMYRSDGGDMQMIEYETSFKEKEDLTNEEFHGWNRTGESKPLMVSTEDESKEDEYEHPFHGKENQVTCLLSAREGILQGC